MGIIQKFVLVTVLLMDSGDFDTTTVVLASCPDQDQYYEYMEGRAKDNDEGIQDWRATCMPVSFPMPTKT